MKKLEAFLQKYGTWIIFFISFAIAVGATYFFYGMDDLLGYKDSLSRLNIARGVTDNQTPGLVQLGTIWLPLFQFLMVPFAAIDVLWRTGLAGSIVSGVSYIIAALYIYKLASIVTNKYWLGLAGAFIFMFNPNIVYMQSIAMTELLMCATLAGTFYHLLNWIKHDKLIDLILSAFWVALASLDRYEGWLAVVACCALVGFEYLVVRKSWKKAEGYVILYATLAFFGLFLWFLWNQVFWGDLRYVLGGGGVESVTKGYKATSVADVKGYIYTSLQAIRHNVGTGLFAILPISLLVVFSKKDRKLSLYAIALALVPSMFIAISVSRGLPLVASGNPHQAYDLRYGISGVILAAIAVPIIINQLPRVVSIFKPVIAIAAVLLSINALPYAYYAGALSWNNGGEVLNAGDRLFAQEFKETYKGGRILMSSSGSTLNPIKHIIGVDLKNYTWEGNDKKWKRALLAPRKESIRYIIMARDQEDSVYYSYLTHRKNYAGYTKIYDLGSYIVLEAKEDLKGTRPPTNSDNVIDNQNLAMPIDNIQEVIIKEGESQTLIVRGQISSLPEVADLTAAQKLYIETKYVNELGRTNLMYASQTATIDITRLITLAKESRQLAPSKLAAWQTYVSN